MGLPATADHGGSQLSQLLGRLGVASLSATQATNDVQDSLERIAVAYDRPELRIFVLPTVVLIEDQKVVPPRTEFFPVKGLELRLDQAGDVEKLIVRGCDGTLSPADILEQLNEIERRAPRFGVLTTSLGNVLLTLGFGMMLNPSLAALPVYVLLGATAGIVIRLANSIRTLSLILPIFMSFAMTLIVVHFVQPHVDENLLRLLAPALVSFLPGLQLTVAAVELTNGQIMAGASRMLYGFARLGLLGFGVFAGMSVLHDTPSAGSTLEPLGWWAPWVGTALAGIGYYFASGAPRGSMLWILAMMIVAYGAQSIGNITVGSQLSGFVGAAVIPPTAYLLSRWQKAPASAVLLTCGYWLLVPGALGFIGVGEAESATSGADETLITTLVSLISIATGMLIGVGLSRGAGTASRRLGSLTR